MKKSYLLAILLIIFLAGCGSDPEPAEESDTEETSSLLFRNLDLQQEENTFVLSGEVTSDEQVFYYRLEQGEEELQEEAVYELEAEAGTWESFEITGEIPASASEAEASPILTLYGKAEDGETIHPNYIPIDMEN